MSRPPFKPTAAMRKQVAIAAGGGMSHAEIALGLGIARNTLVKHFERELSEGCHAKRLAVFAAMHAAAVKGNVAAQKAYLALTPASVLEAASPTKKLGKKERAQADAVGAESGTEWDGLLGANVMPIRGAG